MRISCGTIQRIKKTGQYECRFMLNNKSFLVGEFDNRIDAEIALALVKAEWLILTFEEQPPFINLIDLRSTAIPREIT